MGSQTSGDVPSAPGAGQGRPDQWLTTLGCLWDIVQDLGQVLKYTRLPLLVTILAGLALIFVAQGQDLIVIHAEQPEFLLTFWFYLAVIFWAVNAWYWARATLQHGATIPWEESEACKEKGYLGGRLKRVKWLVRQVPRAIGTGAFLMIAIAQVAAAAFYDGIGTQAIGTLYAFGAFSLGFAVAFFAFTAYRREIAKAIGPGIASATGQMIGSDWRTLPMQPEHKTAQRVGELPTSLKVSFVILSLGVLLLFVLVLVSPATLGAFGPDIVFLVGASLWIAPGTWLLFVSRRGDFPVLTLLLVLALAFSFFNDNHALRISTGASLPEPANRPALAEAVESWRTGDSVPPAMVVVATAGGGSRAAYWTGSVLGTIQDLHAEFDDQLFGISGVSGGSVGATVYRALLTTYPDGDASCAGEEAANNDQMRFRHCAKAILGEDFLAPTVAAMLFPDLVQRFLPVPLLPDRASALEQAWEAAWDDAMISDEQRGVLGRDFLTAWPSGNGESLRVQLPALFINGTSVATGKRIVTSNLNVSGSLTDAFDFFRQWPMHVPMSTAAHNSARFTYVSPAGRLERDRTETDRNTLDRIVDGGYFENFGAATALDLLRDMQRTSCTSEKPCADKLIVIQISSDPSFRGVSLDGEPGAPGVENNASLPKRSPGRFATELLSPILALLKTRTARGVLATQELHDWVTDLDRSVSKDVGSSADQTRSKAGGWNSAHFIEFRLDIPKNKTAPPLGWVLSDAAKTTMDCQLLRPSNRSNLERLGRLLDFETATFLDGMRSRCP